MTYSQNQNLSTKKPLGLSNYRATFTSEISRLISNSHYLTDEQFQNMLRNTFIRWAKIEATLYPDTLQMLNDVITLKLYED